MTVAIIWGLLSALWALDALRLRGRIAALHALTHSAEPVASQHRFLCAPGVELDEATRRAASAYAVRERLDVLDLIPADLSTWQTLVFAANVDTPTFLRDKFAKGCSAGFAMLVDAELSARVEAGAEPPNTLHAWALRLKYYATTGMAFAVAPGMTSRALPDDTAARLALLKRSFGERVGPVLSLQALFLVAALVGPFVAPLAGGLALAMFQLQAPFIFIGSSMHPTDLRANVFLRALLELQCALRMAWFDVRSRGADPRVETRRVKYAELVANGTARFFEARRPDCPLCGASDLVLQVQTGDLIQRKPGTFRLERCQRCQHVFQNPRLSLEGLDYYYSDFYDGLGEAQTEAIFGYGSSQYVERARSVAGICIPRTWLDVGAGHGHFCCMARGVWPDSRFDGLDLSETIEEAARRGWVDRGYRGLFPDLAPVLADDGVTYDVVSMSHYLEHTRDPRAEIAAAHRVLSDNGTLMIEVPDPESRLRLVLGRYWLPWMQPQHQHFVSVANMTRILREEGFEVARWQRGEVHIAADFLGGAVLALGTVQSRDSLPWRPSPSAARRWLAAIAFWPSALVQLVGWAIDRCGAPFFRRVGWSNAYRVVARKV